MAIYLQLPPGSEGDVNDSWTANRAHPLGASSNRATGRRMSHSRGLAALGLGYLNLPMAGPWALKNSGKCSPLFLSQPLLPSLVSGPGRDGP